MEGLVLAVAGFFAVGTFWFALAMLGFLFWITACAWADDSDYNSDEDGVWTTVAFLLLLGFLWLVTGTSPKDFVANHSWGELISYFLGYVGVGFGWSLFKWRSKVKKWYVFSKKRADQGKKLFQEKPQVKDNLDSIVYWMVYFPFSMLAYFIGEWLLKLYKKLKELIMKLRFVYDWVEGSYKNDPVVINKSNNDNNE